MPWRSKHIPGVKEMLLYWLFFLLCCKGEKWDRIFSANNWPCGPSLAMKQQYPPTILGISWGKSREALPATAAVSGFFQGRRTHGTESNLAERWIHMEEGGPPDTQNKGFPRKAALLDYCSLFPSTDWNVTSILHLCQPLAELLTVWPWFELGVGGSVCEQCCI